MKQKRPFSLHSNSLVPANADKVTEEAFWEKTRASIQEDAVRTGSKNEKVFCSSWNGKGDLL